MVVDTLGVTHITFGHNAACQAELQIVNGRASHSGTNPGGPFSRFVIDCAKELVPARPEIRTWLDALPAEYKTYGPA